LWPCEGSTLQNAVHSDPAKHLTAYLVLNLRDNIEVRGIL